MDDNDSNSGGSFGSNDSVDSVTLKNKIAYQERSKANEMVGVEGEGDRGKLNLIEDELDFQRQLNNNKIGTVPLIKVVNKTDGNLGNFEKVA